MLPTIRKRAYVPHYTDDIFGRDLLSHFFSDGADLSVPAVNIKENDKAYEIEMALPGLDKNDISLKFENEVITISSAKKSEQENNSGTYSRKEFSYNSFSRSFSVPEDVNPDNIKASHKNGILFIDMPKTVKPENQKNKTIKIA